MEILLQQGNTLDHQVAVLHHGAVVAGDEGLALGAVNENGLDGALADGVQLGPQGEGRAAQTHNAALPHGGQEAVQIMNFRGLDAGVHLHLAVALDEDGLSLSARLALIGLDGGYGAGNAGIDRGRVSAFLPGDQLAHTDIIAHGHNRLCRLAGVHVHGQQHLAGGRHRHRGLGRRALIVGQFQG